MNQEIIFLQTGIGPISWDFKMVKLIQAGEREASTLYKELLFVAILLPYWIWVLIFRRRLIGKMIPSSPASTWFCNHSRKVWDQTLVSLCCLLSFFYPAPHRFQTSAKHEAKSRNQDTMGLWLSEWSWKDTLKSIGSMWKSKVGLWNAWKSQNHFL